MMVALPPESPRRSFISLEKRTWCYVQAPRTFDMAPCACGNDKTQWSEYKKHLWCNTCKIDFIPEYNGIFDGPIPVKAAQMMGISFTRIIIETGEVIPFSVEALEYNREVIEAWNEFLTEKPKEDDGI